MSNLRVLLVGCGKMGGALLREWVAQKTASVTVVEPSSLIQEPGVVVVKAPQDVAPSFHPDVIVFAVKPQDTAQIAPAYARFTQSLFLSLAAGLRLHALTKMLGTQAPYAILRTMPNLPASVGMGMSVLVANEHVTPTQRAYGEKLMRAVGEIAWLEDEGMMNAVTALSGSGPAYLFALLESMEDAAVDLGLPQALAQKLARQTLIGSGALLARSSESPGALRKAVTSPGGTTAAALQRMTGLAAMMKDAMHAAVARADTLGRDD